MSDLFRPEWESEHARAALLTRLDGMTIPALQKLLIDNGLDLPEQRTSHGALVSAVYAEITINGRIQGRLMIVLC